MMDFEVALDQFEIFILILMRMASFVYTAPFFNTSGTPQKTKVGFSVFLSILVYSLQGSDVSVSYNGVIGYAALVGFCWERLHHFAHRLFCFPVRLLIWIQVFPWHRFMIRRHVCRSVSWGIFITTLSCFC